MNGRDGNKMLVHEGGGGIKGHAQSRIRSCWILGDERQRYPLTEVGVENLMRQLVQANGTELLELANPVSKEPRSTEGMYFDPNTQKNGRYDFHVAQIFVDDN